MQSLLRSLYKPVHKKDTLFWMKELKLWV
jgi:hypothetical protein